MRRLLLFSLMLVPAIAFAATHEMHSALHSLTVEVIDGPDPGYIARVTDLATGKLLMGVKLPIAGAKAEGFDEKTGRHIIVEVRRTKNGLWGSLDVERDGKAIDAMQTRWVTKPGLMRVGGDVKMPVIVRKVEPIYPEAARQERLQGIVIIEVTIDKEGNIKDTEVLKPLDLGLDQAAVDAVRQWKFQPATLDGQPVDAIFNLTINFRLK